MVISFFLENEFLVYKRAFYNHILIFIERTLSIMMEKQAARQPACQIPRPKMQAWLRADMTQLSLFYAFSYQLKYLKTAETGAAG